MTINLAPTTYTVEELAIFMMDNLRSVAEDLVWQDTSVTGQYTQIVTDACVRYFGTGGHDVSEAENVMLLRLYARCEVWRKVMQSTASLYDVQGPLRGLKREQVHMHAVGQFRLAESDLAAYLSEQLALDDPIGERPARSTVHRVNSTW